MPLLALSLFLGFYPKPVLDRVQPTVGALITHVECNSDFTAPAVSNPDHKPLDKVKACPPGSNFTGTATETAGAKP